MGIEDRDRYRDGESTSRQRRLPGLLVLGVVIAALFAAAAVRHVVDRKHPTLGGEHRSLVGDTKLDPAPGLPEITLHNDSLDRPHDRWKAYLADEGTCPGAERTNLSLAQQADIMVCLVNFARRQRSLAPLVPVALLNGSSLAKAARIARCREFAHAACGQQPDSDARAAGYNGPFGENLYIAGGRDGAPRIALDGWLNSPGHRENLFRPEWRTEGIAVQRLDTFGNYRDATLWVNEFGTG